MRTVTRKIESDGKETRFPIPKEWEKIILVSVSGEPVEYEIESIDKKKRTLQLKKPVDAKKLINAHVILKD